LVTKRSRYADFYLTGDHKHMSHGNIYYVKKCSVTKNIWGTLLSSFSHQFFYSGSPCLISDIFSSYTPHHFHRHYHF